MPNDNMDDDNLQDAIDSGLVENAPPPEAPQPGPDGQQPEHPEKPEQPGQPEKDDEPKTALEAVRRALDADRDKKAQEVEARKGPAAKEPGQPEAPDEKADDKSDILTQEEWQKLTPRVKKRLGILAAEAKTERTARESLEPRARMYDQMEQFVQASGMSQQQFDDGLKIMAWLNTDPARAYEALKPIVANLQEHVGERLPQDLQEQVDDGRISPDLASQLVYERSQRALLEGQAEQQRRLAEEQQVQQQQQQQFNEHQQVFSQAINAWEARQKQADPDYAHKVQWITDRATIMVQAEKPTNIEALMNLMDRAKAMVDKHQVGPARRPINPVNTPSASGQARPQPKTALEAVTMGLEAGRH